MTEPDEYADWLAEVASELAQRVRDDDPEANARWLRNTVPNRDDRDRLLFALAAAVPDDRSWLALTAWTVQSQPARKLAPHGTAAAAKRHRYHGEPLCDDCVVSERVRERERKRAQRAAVAETEAA